MSVNKVLSALRLNANFMRQVVVWQRIAARKARPALWPTLDPRLIAALKTNGVQTLYSHQGAAVKAALDGQNIVIATSTASGKSLAYSLPVMHKLLADPSARALYLFPTKALTQDQLKSTQALIQAGNLPLKAHILDGDTPRHQRTAIRRSNGILMTNPDMLHAGMLPYHTRWRSLFAKLDYIVIDEIHSYRGVFGSHVANVLRRLRRVCQFYGSDPQFICCSATIANPAKHAARLTGSAPFTLIGSEMDGAPRGEKRFILYNPPLIDEELGLRQSIYLSAMDAATAFIDGDCQTVTFVRSRQGVELLLTYLRDQMLDLGRDPNLINGYRGGYLPLERRAIEADLRAGKTMGVVATNALELGIDIGALDAAVLTGYPGTIASVWQQAGRAGRRSALSAAILIAGNSPLDQYICRHPRYLFGSSPENALINPDNERILLNHLACAAYEIPFGKNEAWGDLGVVADFLDVLRQDGDLHESGDNFHWIGEGTPQHKLSLRSSGSDQVIVQAMTTASDGSQSAQVIAAVDVDSAPLLVHTGAIYSHQAQTFLIDRLDWEERIAWAQAVTVDYYTRATVGSQIKALDSAETIIENDLLHAHGDVLVITQATGYRQIKRYSHETLGFGDINLPARPLDTTGYWLVIGEKLADKLYTAGILNRPNDYGTGWPQARLAALERDNHRCRTCNADGLLHVHHLRPFREYGFVRGVNRQDEVANQLDNLVTLCPRCHMQAEKSVQQRSAMAGLAYLLRNLAPLFLMCDATDISVSAETRNPLTNAPTIVIYEHTPAGVGFSQHLFTMRDELLKAVLARVNECTCRDGCPACVGPTGETGPETKQQTKRLLGLLVTP